jgi:hypothetical protein
VLKSFIYHRPAPEAVGRITELRRAFSDLAEKIEALVPESRERSVSITTLETAQMWVTKAIVINDRDSFVEEPPAPPPPAPPG